MRKHIKVKVRTLLLITIFACILLFSERLYWQGIKLYNSLAPVNHQIELQSMTTRTLESENNRLSLILNENNYEIFMLVAIEDGYMIEGMRIRKEDATKVYDTFLSYEERYDLYDDYPDYVLNVALTQWFSGNSDLAFDIIDGFDDATINDDVHVIKAGMSLGLYDFKSVLESMSNVKSDIYDETQKNIYYFLGHFIGVELPDFELESFKARRNSFEKPVFSGKFSHLFGNIFRLNAESQNDSMAQPRETGLQTDDSITGQVNINDQPVYGAFVYEKNFKGMSGITTTSHNLIPTDENGNFIIKNIHDDFLGVGLAIPWQLIHDKQLDREFYLFADITKDSNFDFDFHEAVKFKSLSLKDDVLYYEIVDPVHLDERSYYITAKHTDPAYDINSRASYQIKSNQLKGSIPLDALRLNSNFSFEFTSSADELEISRFIEPLYLTDTFAFTVTPYYPGESDRYVSNGFFTDALSELMIIKGHETISKGDELLSEGKISDAISWYDENRSLHSLKILSALYRKGNTVEEDLDFSQKLGGVDSSKSIYYTKLLISEYGEEENLLWTLSNIYKESQNFKEESTIYEKLILMSPENSYLHEAYAISLINQGRFSEGVEYLADHVSESRRLYMINSYFVLANLTDHMDKSIHEHLTAIDGIENYKRFHEQINDGEYLEAKSWLDSQPEGELKLMYQLLFEDTFRHLNTEMSFDDFFTKYVDTVKTMKTESISQLLKDIKRYHNWF